MVQRIENLVPELQPGCLAEEKAGRLSQETVTKLDEIGVFRISTPLEYGGLALSVAEQRRIYTAVGKIAGSTGWVSWVTTTHVRWIAMFPEQVRDEVYGLDWVGPLVSGVISGHGPGRARRVEGGYMLSGRWPFCSGCRHTAWSILGAMTEGPDGTPDVIILLVPAVDLEILDDWAVSGMKASGSNTVQIATEVFVPAYRTLSIKDAAADKWASEPPIGQVLYRNQFIAYTTILSGSTPLGIAKGALDYYKARIDKRGIVATDYRVQSEAAITHFQLAETTSRIDAAERLLSADCEELDRRAAAGEPCDDVFHAKLKFDVASSVRSCTEAVEILHRGSGASTIHEANPMQRYARDIRVATVHAQFNYETCAENYGRALCGKPLFGNFTALEKKATA
jgi:alkylation response protein AidB-like acyl-CoA dehydrogenase